MTLATIGSISIEKGIELVSTYEKSINVEKFREFLIALRDCNKRRKLAIFLDRLNVHRSPKITKLAKVLGIEIVYNAAYSPDYNPIERVFGLVKADIKKARLKAIINETQPDDRVIINEAFAKIKKETVSNFIGHSL